MVAEMASTLLSDPFGRPLVTKGRGPRPINNSPEEIRRAKRALLERAKRSERDFATWLVRHNGPERENASALAITSTGRIGHITGIQADNVSRSYLGENKNERPPVTLAKYWQKICQRAIDWHKDPVLRWDPPNAADYPVAGKPLPDMHIITVERHGELLEKERWYDEHHTEAPA